MTNLDSVAELLHLTPRIFRALIKVGLLDGATGAEIAPTTTLELTEASQTFVLSVEGLSKDAEVVPSVLREFSAPVRLEYSPPLSDDRLAFLMAYDTDSFNRWEAAQKLAMKVVLAAAAESSSGAELSEPPVALMEAFGKTLASAGTTDNSLLAYTLALPALSELSDAMPVPVDPLALVAARKHVKKALATTHHDALVALYDELTPAPGGKSFRRGQQASFAKKFYHALHRPVHVKFYHLFCTDSPRRSHML